MYQALYRKWRPQTFDDVVGQSHITRTLKKQVTTGHLSHAYLFTGTRGTGKTTCAKLLAKAVNCENPVGGNPCGQCAACRGIDSGSILDVVELDAASNNGVDQVRALRDEAVYAPAAVRRRVYIIDEVHMLSVAAFNALLKILEEPPEHLMFILATTELHKVPATILSRCQRFSFKRIQPADIQNRLRYIAQAEGIDLTEDGAALLARLADGALRDALSLLDQCAVSGGRVDKDAVLDALGLAGNTKTAHIMNHIRRGETAQALTELGELYAAGKDVGAVLSELAGLTRDLLLRQTTGGSAPGLMAGGYDEATMQALSRGLSSQRLLHMLTLLQDIQAKLKTSANRRTDAELCIIQLCDRTLDGSVLSLSERLSRIEAALANGQLGGGGNRRPFEDISQAEETGDEPILELAPSQEETQEQPAELVPSPDSEPSEIVSEPPEEARLLEEVPPFPE
ncbi:MAG: DNA polymerase III subunit gamma/tau, partial [Clostridiales bacterium]|nr:DNA polymerase III subunit gamma/tau [Clostridiales bacterium]